MSVAWVGDAQLCIEISSSISGAGEAGVFGVFGVFEGDTAQPGGGDSSRRSFKSTRSWENDGVFVCIPGFPHLIFIPVSKG